MTSPLGDALRSEAAIADRPGQGARLEEIASAVDSLVPTNRQPQARRLALGYELARHARMHHPQGRAFHGSCLCGMWTGPNTKYAAHLAAALDAALDRKGL